MPFCNMRDTMAKAHSQKPCAGTSKKGAFPLQNIVLFFFGRDSLIEDKAPRIPRMLRISWNHCAVYGLSLLDKTELLCPSRAVLLAAWSQAVGGQCVGCDSFSCCNLSWSIVSIYFLAPLVGILLCIIAESARSMSAKKKVLLKVIILGDSGWPWFRLMRSELSAFGSCFLCICCPVPYGPLCCGQVARCTKWLNYTTAHCENPNIIQLCL